VSLLDGSKRGMSPPAYWPPGSRQGRRCCRGELPGGQARMSGTAPRSSPRRSPSPVTACPGPRCAGHGRWRGGDAPSGHAASLASSAALPVPAAGQPWPRPEPQRWTLRRPPVYPLTGRKRRFRWRCSLGGVERPRLLAGLRPAPPSAASDTAARVAAERGWSAAAGVGRHRQHGSPGRGGHDGRPSPSPSRGRTACRPGRRRPASSPRRRTARWRRASAPPPRPRRRRRP
jgi:hypothetical protein